jgi:hypothetical protein
MDASMVCARAAVLGSVVLALAGCSGAPSETQVHDAMIKRAQRASAAMVTPDFKEQIAKSKLESCAKAEAESYLCELSMPTGNRPKIRFVKADGAWAVADDR